MSDPDKFVEEKPEARVDFARRLRECRVLNGFRTARSLAKSIGIDENRYTRYERAEVEPDLTLIRQLAAALKTTPNDLLGVASSPMPGFQDGTGGALPMESGAGSRTGQPSRANRVSAILWALANAIAEARLAADDGRDLAGLTRLQAVSAIYQQLSPDPFGTIAAVAKERAVAKASAELNTRIQALVDDLARTMADAGPLPD